MRARRRARGPGAAAYKRTRLARGRTPWRDASYCAVDLELSGLDPKQHETVSFGAVPIEDRRVELSAVIHGRFRPLRSMSEEAIRVHGMRAADLGGAAQLDIAIDPLLAVMAVRIPVVHVAAVERGFLRSALRRQGLRLRTPMIDTSVLALVWLHERDGRRPVHVTHGSRHGAWPAAHHPHDAVGDALTTAQAFVTLAYTPRRTSTGRSLAPASQRLELLLAHPARQRRTSRGIAGRQRSISR